MGPVARVVEFHPFEVLMSKPRKSFLRTGHGAGKGTPHIEVVGDELSKPIPAPAQAADSVPLCFRPDGRIADSATARALGARGGRESARRVRLVDSLGLAAIGHASTFAPYRRAADDFVALHLGQLRMQAGGEVGPGPSTMVSSAALQLAASRWAFDMAAESGDPAMFKLGSTMANDSRQNLLAAYELSVREAEARGKAHTAGQGKTLPAWFAAPTEPTKGKP